jgi:lipoprotein-anchoring transpeptidase ErfK/SrfK
MKKLFAGAVVALFAMQGFTSAANASSLEADIDLSSQTMTVSRDGMVQYRWKVSTARKGYVTPVGRYTAKWASINHRSRKYNNAPMPYAIFYHGGYAVHATYDIKRLGRPASHGCVRLHPNDAAKFFSMANSVGLRNTKIVISQ